MHEVDLPEAYARYFELRLEGLTTSEIARHLELDVSALHAFIELAHAKLAHVTVTPPA